MGEKQPIPPTPQRGDAPRGKLQWRSFYSAANIRTRQTFVNVHSQNNMISMELFDATFNISVKKKQMAKKTQEAL